MKWCQQFFLFLVLMPSAANAQCDTLVLNQEAQAVEDLIWADYPRTLALSGDMVAKYHGEGGLCEARALLALAKTMWTNGDYDESTRLLRDAVRFSRRAGDAVTTARSYNVIANNFYYQAYYDSAEANFIRCRDIFDVLKMRTGQIEVLHDMALMYHRQGNYAASLRALLKSETLKDLEPDFVHHVGDFSDGNTYFIDTLYYQNEIVDEQRLLQKFRKEGNLVGVYQSLINISIAYHELGDHRRSGYFAAKGSAAMKEMGHYPFWYLAARQYGLAGMKDSCFYFHARALREFPMATQIKIATTYQQLGNSHLGYHQGDSALWYYELALELNVRMNNRITVPGLHLGLAQVYRMKGDLVKAEHHLLKGLTLAKNTSVLHASNLYKFGQELYESLGRYDRALEFAKRHMALADSIDRNKDAMTMIRFQAQFETARKVKELDEARLIVRNRTITVASLAVLTSLSIGFICVLYIQRRKIQHQNEKLVESNTEQKALTLEVHHRVKNNLQYIVSLLSLQAQTVDNEELAQQIEEIKTRIMTMGLIHQRLYQMQGIQAVHLPSFVHELIDNLMLSLPNRVTVKKNLSIEPIRVDVDSAIALGLLINELATNAIKHAFGNHQSPEFGLMVAREGNHVRLSVSDNGPGYSLQMSKGRGFGIRLMELLLRKLKGTVVQINPTTLEIRLTGLGIVG